MDREDVEGTEGLAGEGKERQEREGFVNISESEHRNTRRLRATDS